MSGCFFHFYFSFESVNVEKLTVCMISKFRSDIFVSDSIFQHDSKYRTEESGSTNNFIAFVTLNGSGNELSAQGV